MLKLDREFHTSGFEKLNPKKEGFDEVEGLEFWFKNMPDSYRGGRVWAKAFFGKQAKPVWFLSFKNWDAFLDHARRQTESRKATIKYKQSLRETKKAFVPNVKPGDIFYTSWGWEQTNVEFFQVIEMKGKSSAVFRQIAREMSQDDAPSSMSAYAVPVPNDFVGEPFKKRILEGNSIKFASYRIGHLRTDKDKKHYVSWYA